MSPPIRRRSAVLPKMSADLFLFNFICRDFSSWSVCYFFMLVDIYTYLNNLKTFWVNQIVITWWNLIGSDYFPNFSKMGLSTFSVSTSQTGFIYLKFINESIWFPSLFFYELMEKTIHCSCTNDCLSLCYLKFGIFGSAYSCVRS